MDKYEMFPSLKLYERVGCPYVVTSDRWNGPLWTGVCMMLDTSGGYGDQGFAHELFHWMAASADQRLYPDMALGMVTNAHYLYTFTSSTTPHLYHSDIDEPPDDVDRNPLGNSGWGEMTADLPEADRQEHIACGAMWFYGALVGQVGWDDPNPPLHGAAKDFNGGGGPQFLVTEEDWDAVYREIITVLAPEVSRETYDEYRVRLISASVEEERLFS